MEGPRSDQASTQSRVIPVHFVFLQTACVVAPRRYGGIHSPLIPFSFSSPTCSFSSQAFVCHPRKAENPNPSEDSKAAAAATGGEMVFFALLVGAELDGLTNLPPSGGCDDPSYPYYFKLRCESCGETSAKTTCVSLDEVVDLSNGKGTANLVQKCKFCTREGSIVMIPGQGTH
ncbi:hypothetical protein ACQ4PT_012833 [Festuca glaucescens]